MTDLSTVLGCGVGSPAPREAAKIATPVVEALLQKHAVRPLGVLIEQRRDGVRLTVNLESGYLIDTRFQAKGVSCILESGLARSGVSDFVHDAFGFRGLTSICFNDRLGNTHVVKRPVTESAKLNLRALDRAKLHEAKIATGTGEASQLLVDCDDTEELNAVLVALKASRDVVFAEPLPVGHTITVVVPGNPTTAKAVVRSILKSLSLDGGDTEETFDLGA